MDKQREHLLILLREVYLKLKFPSVIASIGEIMVHNVETADLCSHGLWVGQARDLRTRQTTCPNVCDLSPLLICSRVLLFRRGGRTDVTAARCVAAGEREYCGDRGHAVCGQGMTCEYRSSARVRACGCVTPMSQCGGSDGRTYPSVCRLKAENRRAEMSGIPAVIDFHPGGLCEDRWGKKTVCFGVHNNWPTGS